MPRVVPVWFPACLAAVLAFGSSAYAGSQTPAQTAPQTTPAAGRLRVFLECDSCFQDYLREEIEWVDFVRQPQDADVHVLSSSNQTGGGGREVAFRFVGLGRFQGVNTELKSVSTSGDTDDMRRQKILRTVTVALLGYLERAGRSGDVKIDVEAATQGGGQTTVADDPWKAWVFSVRGGGSADLQERNREFQWQVSASADRVTERWKLSFGANAQSTREHFKLDEDEEGEPLKVVRRSREVNWFVARSLGPHWSWGIDGGLRSSTFGNQEFAAEFGPAIEYSVFPYEQYASRQLRIKYAAGVRHARYNEVTLFGKLRETNPAHLAAATLEQVQPWGELRASVEFLQYLHDTGKYRLEADVELSFRISRGLSLGFDSSASRIRDQLSLPLRGATPEEVLLRLRELQSSYQFDFSLNMTYRFGSIFNNIVNPRFGR